MGLLEKAYETYENHKHLVGKVEEGKSPLLPVAHMMLNIQIEITLDIKGKFISANYVDKADAATLIPITIKSGSRSGKYPPAYPLSDKITYIRKGDTWQYKEYINQMDGWVESSFANDKLRAIYEYVKGGTVCDDLKEQGIDFKESDNVRWRVIDGEKGDNDACWQSMEMFESWQKYYFSIMSGEEGLCMLTGKTTVLSDSQPKGIVAKYNNSKLISANDSSNFTYRGRFIDSKEALTVGYIASQYAHNALIWLTRNQSISFSVGGRTFICWNPNGYKVPCIWNSIFSGGDSEDESITPSNYQARIYNTLSGLKNELPANEDVIIASFDAATTGRLSLTYYCELKGSDFLRRIEAWYSTCSWIYGKYGIQSPSVRDIVQFAFGTPRGDSYPDIKDGIYREQFQRILKCVSEQSVIPYDLLKNLVNNASRPQSYKNCYSKVYRKLMFITCALVRKYYNDMLAREEWTLSLESEKKDRSYQFGRLLAVMEKAEIDTYNADEQREANAIRLQSAFCDRPWHYTNIIHQKLAPYFARHKPGARRYFKRLIGQIMGELANYPENELDKKLGDTYLLGYYLQRNEMYKKHDNVAGAKEREE